MTSRARVLWMMAGWDNRCEETAWTSAVELNTLLCGSDQRLVPLAGAALHLRQD